MHQDAWPSLRVFLSLSTQWRYLSSMSSALIGIEYTAVEPVLRLQCVPKKQWPAIFEDLQLMENAALKTLRDEAKQ